MATGEEKDAWPWLDFGNAPWEANESAYMARRLRRLP
jgi:hypothetical protein